MRYWGESPSWRSNDGHSYAPSIVSRFQLHDLPTPDKVMPDFKAKLIMEHYCKTLEGPDGQDVRPMLEATKM